MSNLSLERLLFDPADVAGSPVLGSYLLGGTTNGVISDTSGALDVNIVNDLTVDLDGVYVLATNATPDSVGLIANSRGATLDETSQIERMTVGVPSDAVVNADVHALDVNSFLMGYNGTTWDRIKSTSGELNVVFSNTTIAVTATDLDIRDLAYATDSVTAHQGGSWTVAATQSGTWTVATDVTPNIVPLQQAISVTDTAVALPASPLANRMRIQIQNKGSDPIYIGKSTVTVASGLEIPKGATESLEAGPAALWYAIAPTGKTVNVRVLEW